MAGLDGATGTITWSDGADWSETLDPAWSIDVLTIPPGFAPGNAPRLYVSFASELTPVPDPSTLFTTTSFLLYYVDADGAEHRFSTALQGGTAPNSFVLGSERAVVTEDGPPDVFQRTLPAGALNLGGTVRLKGISIGPPLTLTGTVVAMLYDQGIVVNQFWELFPTDSTLIEVLLQLQFTQFDIGGLDVTTTRDVTQFDGFFGPYAAGLFTSDVCGKTVSPTATAPTVAATGATGWVDVITRINGSLFASLGFYGGPFTSNVPIHYILPQSYYMYLAYELALGLVDTGGFTLASIGLGTTGAASTAVKRGRSFAQLIGD